MQDFVTSAGNAMRDDQRQLKFLHGNTVQNQIGQGLNYKYAQGKINQDENTQQLSFEN